MVFSTPLFLFYFLPAFLVAYYLVPRRFKNEMALFGSLLFYAWGAPIFAYVLVASTAVDYWISRRIAAEGPGMRTKRWVGASLLLNVGTLLYAKYANFFVEQVNGVLEAMGSGPVSWTGIALPIGISFFTFQKISYVVDVARGNAKPASSFLNCLLYVALFPQLIAGPIVRYHDIDSQIRSRRVNLDQVTCGMQRFVIGLAKKVILANAMAQFADGVYGANLDSVPWQYAWLAVAAYYFQIYFDFSGYSDMAIGLGRMMGFEFLENFNRPYIAKTFSEFWRRWHMSLSNWMREYLYIPLGGNRVPQWRTYVNLWIVFLISGFWHGASWNFIVWGAYQGVFLTLDRLFFLRWAEKIPGLLLRLGMVFLVMMSWVVFRAEDLGQALGMYGRLFGGGGPDLTGSVMSANLRFDFRAQVMLVICCLVAFLPWSDRYRKVESHVVRWFAGRGLVFGLAFTWLLLAWTILVLANSTHNPFIYFRF